MKGAIYEGELLETDAAADWLEVVRRHVDSLKFGTVQIVVHDSRVVQIERTEKIRFRNPVALSHYED